MSHILNRFNFQSPKWDDGVVLTLAIIWIVVLTCVVSSILAQPFERRQRVFWAAMVVCLPVVGLLAYLPFAFRKEELPHMFQRKAPKKPRKLKQSSSNPDA